MCLKQSFSYFKWVLQSILVFEPCSNFSQTTISTDGDWLTVKVKKIATVQKFS